MSNINGQEWLNRLATLLEKIEKYKFTFASKNDTLYNHLELLRTSLVNAINFLQLQIDSKLDESTILDFANKDLSNITTDDFMNKLNLILESSAHPVEFFITTDLNNNKQLGLSWNPSIQVPTANSVYPNKSGSDYAQFQDVVDVLNKITQGTGIKIDKNADGTITINATGGGGGSFTCNDLNNCDDEIKDIVRPYIDTKLEKYPLNENVARFTNNFSVQFPKPQMGRVVADGSFLLDNIFSVGAAGSTVGFTSSFDPATDEHLTNKKYVDTQVTSTINPINSQLNDFKSIVQIEKNNDTVTGIKVMSNLQDESGNFVPIVQVAKNSGQITIFNVYSGYENYKPIFQTYPQNNSFAFLGKTKPQLLYVDLENDKIFYGRNDNPNYEIATKGELNGGANSPKMLSSTTPNLDTEISITAIPLKSGNGTLNVGFDSTKQEYYARIDNTNLQNIFMQEWIANGYQEYGNVLSAKMNSGVYLVRYNWQKTDSTNSPNDYIELEFSYSGSGTKVLDSLMFMTKNSLMGTFQQKLIVNENGVSIINDFKYTLVEKDDVSIGNVISLYKRSY